MTGIVASGVLPPSTAARNPNDVRHGEGVYLSDIVPGSLTPAQLSRRFLGHPFRGRRFTHYVTIDVDGWEIIEGRPGILVAPGGTPGNLTGRIIDHGMVKVQVG